MDAILVVTALIGWVFFGWILQAYNEMKRDHQVANKENWKKIQLLSMMLQTRTNELNYFKKVKNEIDNLTK